MIILCRNGRTTYFCLILIILIPSFLNLAYYRLVDPFGYKVPRHLDEFARDFLEMVQFGWFEEAAESVSRHSSIVSPVHAIQSQAGLLFRGEQGNLDLVDYRVVAANDLTRTTLSYQLQNQNLTSLVKITIDERNHRKDVYDFSVVRLEQPLQVLHHWAHVKITVIHCLFMLVSLFVTVFVLITAARCYDMTIRYKGLWLLFILTGLGQIGLSITDGMISCDLLAIRFPFMGVAQTSSYSPLVVILSIPVGSLAFYRYVYKQVALTHNGGPALR